jgi:hypothetical protein
MHARRSFVFSSGAKAERDRGHVRSRIEILIPRGKIQLVVRSDLGQVFFVPTWIGIHDA